MDRAATRPGRPRAGRLGGPPAQLAWRGTAVIASGTRGDVQPAIALGVALRGAGHAVRLVAGSGFRAWIEGHGLDAAPSRVDMQAVMASPAGRAWVANGHRQLRQQRLMRAIVEEHADALMHDAAAACRDTSLVLWVHLGRVRPRDRRAARRPGRLHAAPARAPRDP